MGLRRMACEYRRVPWSDWPVFTRGTVDGLPAIPWGWADRSVLATRRQLRALGLRPGGAEPVAVLLFGHTRPNRRRVEHAALFLIAAALPKRTATPAQLAALGRALVARRTCRLCGREQEHYLSTVSRLCTPCEDVTDFWRVRAAEHGWGWAA
jgi:hypothetical protein